MFLILLCFIEFSRGLGGQAHITNPIANHGFRFSHIFTCFVEFSRVLGGQAHATNPISKPFSREFSRVLVRFLEV